MAAVPARPGAPRWPGHPEPKPACKGFTSSIVHINIFSFYSQSLSNEAAPSRRGVPLRSGGLGGVLLECLYYCTGRPPPLGVSREKRERRKKRKTEKKERRCVARVRPVELTRRRGSLRGARAGDMTVCCWPLAGPPRRNPSRSPD